MLQRAAECTSLDDVAQDGDIATRDDSLDACLVTAVDDVLVGEQVSGRNGNRTNLMESSHGDPPCQATLEDEHHAVATLDAERQEVGSTLVGRFLVLAVGEVLDIPTVVGP